MDIPLPRCNYRRGSLLRGFDICDADDIRTSLDQHYRDSFSEPTSSSGCHSHFVIQIFSFENCAITPHSARIPIFLDTCESTIYNFHIAIRCTTIWNKWRQELLLVVILGILCPIGEAQSAYNARSLKMARMKNRKYVYSIKDLPYTNLTPESKTKFILGDQALVSFIENPPGTKFPLHAHDCEQILVILEGSEEHTVGGETIHMEAGDVCVHPANVEHGGFTKTGFKGIDIFCPPRDSHVELMRKQGLLED